jgi:hypothetical protein
MLESLLFQTRLGKWLLTRFEQLTGLAIVKADWLGEQISPVASETEPGQNGKGETYRVEITTKELV